MPPVEAAYMDRGPTWDNPPNQKITGWNDDTVRVGVYGDTTATRTIAIAGGSHADMWCRHSTSWASATTSGDDLRQRWVVRWSRARVQVVRQGRPDCNRWAARRWRSWRRTSQTSSSPTTPAHGSGPPARRLRAEGLRHGVRRIQARGQKVVAIRDTRGRTWKRLEPARVPGHRTQTGSAVSVEGGARIHGSGA